jgi:hypothetical protein
MWNPGVGFAVPLWCDHKTTATRGNFPTASWQTDHAAAGARVIAFVERASRR